MGRSSPSFDVDIPSATIQIQTIPGSVAPSVSQTKDTHGTGTVGQNTADCGTLERVERTIRSMAP